LSSKRSWLRRTNPRSRLAAPSARPPKCLARLPATLALVSYLAAQSSLEIRSTVGRTGGDMPQAGQSTLATIQLRGMFIQLTIEISRTGNRCIYEGLGSAMIKVYLTIAVVIVVFLIITTYIITCCIIID
jgi:hypothetical protein